MSSDEKNDSGSQDGLSLEFTRPEFTRDVVWSCVYEGRCAFFTKIAKLIVGAKAGYMRQKDREWVWDRIAFYNYVQGMAGTSARDTVPEPLWGASRGAFYGVVEALRPDAIPIVGKTLAGHLPDLGAHTATARTETFEIPHMSWPGFRYNPWSSRVHRFVGCPASWRMA